MSTGPSMHVVKGIILKPIKVEIYTCDNTASHQSQLNPLVDLQTG